MGLITFDIFGMKWFVCLVWILKHLVFVIIMLFFLDSLSLRKSVEFFIVQVVGLISLLKSRGYSAGFLLKANQGLLHDSGVLFGISTFGIFQNEYLNGF